MSLRGQADLHMHTTFSDGWPTPVELISHVSHNTTLDVIAVTDHDTIEGALRAAEHAERLGLVKVIIGEEVSSRNGHIVGLFLERTIRPGLSAAATVHAIHDQGGLAIAAHPFWRRGRPEARGRMAHGVGWLAADLPFDGVEVENGTPGFFVFNQMARRLNLGLGAAELGCSDGHILDAVGRAYTEFDGWDADGVRASIVAATTSARRRRYRAVGLVRYAAWGLNHQRYAVTAP